MKRWMVGLILALAAAVAGAQSCTPGGGVTCTPNLNLWLPPLNYTNWNVPVNANTTSIDTWSATVLLKAGGTMTGPLVLSGDPTTATQAATKNYVDTHISGLSSFAAPALSWPTWLTPTVTNPTTTPSLAVAASAIPNSAIQNAFVTIGTTTVNLGAAALSVTGVTVDGVTPTVFGYVDPTSSIQTQLNGKATSGANTNITSLAGLTTPLSVSQGGTGLATCTGYPLGSGTLAMTCSPTIPYSSISGTPATGVSSVFGRTGAVVAGGGDYTVAQVTGAAPLNSPVFTGTVTMPFITAGLVQTTAAGVISTSGKSLTGAGAAVPTGPSTTVSGDVVTFTGIAGQLADSGTLLTALAPLASPAFTGTPTAPTAAVGTNTTQLSTTAYVMGEVDANNYCGTTTTCSNTVVANPLKNVWGTVTLAAGTATITGISPAFANTTTPQCSCEDTTSPLQACSAVLASTSSVTVNGNATDVDKYHCWGP